MALREVLLTDAQWSKIQPLLPRRLRSARGGRPPADERRCLEGILWVLKTGARWKDLPREFPSPATCWRRLHEWAESGVLETIWTAFLDELDDQRLLDWDEVFVDGTFSPAKKGGAASAKPSVAREPSGCFWLMARVFLWHAGPRVLRLQRSRWSKTSPRK
jgi:transposase